MASAGTGKKITIVTTDYGNDRDDQKAVSGLIVGLRLDEEKAISDLIANLRPDEEIAFIVSGPQPHMAAAAIAEAYLSKTGHYPIIATGQPFEVDKMPEDRIYGPYNGNPVLPRSSFINDRLVALPKFQEEIDNIIKSGEVERFEQIILAPIHSPLEYYNPSLRLDGDSALEEAWGAIHKVSIAQFDRKGGKTYAGYNYLRSRTGEADRYDDMLVKEGFTRIYCDGSVARFPEFLITATQPNLPGIEASVKAYMEFMQIPWASMPGKSGTTPAIADMHAGMFTPGAEIPFGAHVSGQHHDGFGMERLIREIYGIHPENAEYSTLVDAVHSALESLDEQVLNTLKSRHPGDYDTMNVRQMRAEMHEAMIHTLQKFAQKEGISSSPLHSFQELFEQAEAKGIAISPFGYMNKFKELLFQNSPFVAEVAKIADEEKNRPPQAGDKSYVETMVSLFSQEGARAVVCDAVAVEASRVVLGDPELRKHFTEPDTEIINISQESALRLQETDPDVFRKFELGVVSGLERDGARMIQTPAMAAAKALESLSSRNEIRLLINTTPLARNDAIKRSLEYAVKEGTTINTPESFADNMLKFLGEHKLTRELLEERAERNRLAIMSGTVDAANFIRPAKSIVNIPQVQR